jgi:hypothetical protein
MASAVIDGIATRYQVVGAGPPLLMYAPGGFKAAFAKQDRDQYKSICEAMCRALFDRDTAPGAGPEELMRLDIPALVVPGHDAAHATSAARYLEECLPRSDYWDMPVERQTDDATNARVLEFLAKVNG